VDADALGATRDDLLAALAAADVEARPVWKPMHLQPLYAGCEVIGGHVGADLYTRGICLPSSSSLPAVDQERVIEVVRRVARGVTYREGPGESRVSDRAGEARQT
jgi:pyridoxal phosphate-dependent aminotransferase EpsN